MDVLVENISKSYKSLKAVDNISFSVNKGELFGLIGPDGAGKTTLFRILTTLLLPDNGEASVAGYSIIDGYKSIRKSIGYMPGKFSLYQDLTVEENLNFFATLFETSVSENYHLIKDIYSQIEPFKARKAGKLSGGMKQKLALCCALIHKPLVLFLDEPTTGVDTVSRKEFWEMLNRLKKQGITIIVSTPYMDEASMCDRIALIQKGKIMSVDTPDAIVQNFPRDLFAIKADNMSSLLRSLRDLPYIFCCNAFGEFHHLSFYSSDRDLIPQLMHDLKKQNHSGIEVKRTMPTIEDCFINLMNES